MILQGNSSLCRSLVSLKAMIQTVQMGERGVLVEFENGDLAEATVLECVPMPIQTVLEKYETVFQMP